MGVAEMKNGKTKRDQAGENEGRRTLIGKGRKHRAIVFLLVSLVLLLLSGCTSETGTDETEDEAQKLTVIGFSEVGAESDWRVANTESMKATFTEEKGYELFFDDAKQKQENQIAAIRNFILQEADYIVLAPVVEEGWDGVLQEAKDAGIPVIVVDRMVKVENEDLFAAWVGSDFYEEGRKATVWLENYLNEQGRQHERIDILHVQGTEGSSAQIGRTKSLMEAIENHGSWRLIGSVPGEFTQAKTYEVVRDVLDAGKVPDVIYCENDNSMLGALQALDEKKITHGVNGRVIVISFDASRSGLEACRDGQINLDVECNPDHGPRVEAIIRALAEGKTPEKYCYVEETCFEPEDLSTEFIDARGY